MHPTTVVLVLLAVNYAHARDEFVENDARSNETETELATDVKAVKAGSGPEPPPATGPRAKRQYYGGYNYNNYPSYNYNGYNRGYGNQYSNYYNGYNNNGYNNNNNGYRNGYYNYPSYNYGNGYGYNNGYSNFGSGGQTYNYNGLKVDYNTGTYVNGLLGSWYVSDGYDGIPYTDSAIPGWRVYYGSPD